MLNKKAQVGSAFTWIAATLIIFFIMIIYLVGIAGIVSRTEISREIFASAPTIDRFYTPTDENIFSGFNLAELMNKKVDSSQGSTTIRDLILTETLKYETNVKYNNEFYAPFTVDIVEPLTEAGLQPELRQKVAENLKCEEYILITPVAIIAKIKPTTGFEKDPMTFFDLNGVIQMRTALEQKFEPWRDYFIYYQGKTFRIKYTQRLEC